MKFSVFLLFVSLPMLLTAKPEIHPIQPAKDGVSPGSFYLSGSDPSGVQCIKLEDGGYAFRVDAHDGMKKLISGRRIKLAQGDTLTMKYKIKVRSKGVIAAGMYLYNAKSQHLGALYDHSLQLTPEQSEYVVSGVVPKNPKETSAFDRVAFGLMFFDIKQGCDLDIEYIEYEIQKAPEEEVKIPEF